MDYLGLLHQVIYLGSLSSAPYTTETNHWNKSEMSAAGLAISLRPTVLSVYNKGETYPFHVIPLRDWLKTAETITICILTDKFNNMLTRL
jgi:hypothetical protein